MSLGLSDQTLIWISWFVALIEVILALYVLTLNAWHTAHRHMAGLFFLFALNGFGLGWMASAQTAQQAHFAAIILACTAPAIEPALIMTSVALFKPEWLHNKKRWIWLPFYVLILLPFLLTFSDLILGTNIWFTGIDSSTYRGGFGQLVSFTNGSLYWLIARYSFGFLTSIALGILVYVGLFDKSANGNKRKLAWLLMFANLGVAIIQTIGAGHIDSFTASVISLTIFALAYGYAAFHQLISERSLQRGRFQIRLTALVLVVTIPILIVMMVFVSSRARLLLEKSAIENIQNVSATITTNTSLWSELQLSALQSLALQPDIRSMQPETQAPVLQAIAATNPDMTLVSTLDLNGNSIARSDGADSTNFSSHTWFNKILSGEPVAFQTEREGIDQHPTLVIAAPIHNNEGHLIGAVMLTTSLEALSNKLQAKRVGQKGFAYIVDDQNNILAHPLKTMVSNLNNLTSYPPIKALRTGQVGDIVFEDENGIRWQAFVSPVGNGWGTVVQIPKAELLKPVSVFQQLSWFLITFGAILLVILVSLMIRQSMHPIKTLTETASAISAGDFTRIAPVETEDELGTLTRTFNNMTNQVRDLVTSLEQRVADRTRDLERRAVQLHVTADVAREAAAIHDLDQLLQKAVNEISSRFGFYHAGIFMVDPTNQYAVLYAASSKGGQLMLARQHKLQIGKVGIVGYVAAKGEARIALDVGADAVFFNNPDLPQTRSEVALPLKIKDRVIGVLDVQSTQPSAFTKEDIDILQILADQLALSIENARLFTESRQAFNELQAQIGKQSLQSWMRIRHNENLTFQYNHFGVNPSPLVENLSAFQDDNCVHIPIELHGKKLGTVVLRRAEGAPPWTSTEEELIKTCLKQAALALENARLVDETRHRAVREEILNQLTSSFSRSLDMDSVLQIAVQELGSLPTVLEASVHINPSHQELVFHGSDSVYKDGNNGHGEQVI